MFKTIYWIQHTKKNRSRKKNDKDGKVLLMNNAIYRKAMENLRYRLNVKLVNNQKDYLKCTWKPSSMSHKIFHNSLDAIHKSKLVLKRNKPGTMESVFWNWVKY